MEDCKVGDSVCFLMGDKLKQGVVYIKDESVFEEDGVHYDIYVEDEDTLYKHVRYDYVVDRVMPF